ncbi:MAG: hypothetical protein V3U54_00885 [Thermodesulfobacteriota bacterium]
MFKKLPKPLILLIIIILYSISCSNKKHEMLPQNPTEDLPYIEFSITNSTDVDIIFSLQKQYTEEWISFTLSPGQNELYNNFIKIELITNKTLSDHITVTHDLQSGSEYKIIWNPEKEIWDLVKMENI